MADDIYTSPDGQLTFTVSRRHHGVDLGLEGFAWRTHSDLLVGTFGRSEDTAVDQYVDALLASRLLIAITRDKHERLDVFVSHDPEVDLRYKPVDESLEFQYWGGSAWPTNRYAERETKKRAPRFAPASSVDARSSHSAISMLKRDIDLDWRGWAVAERVGAVALAVLSIATPIGVALKSMVH
jgi:hypothetical protein